ncbi:MAG: hypothetical protein U0Q19_19170 [Kineosporiaceae bacterium]
MALDPSPELWHVPPRRTALLTAVTLALAAGTAWLVARSNPDFQEVISPVQLTVSASCWSPCTSRRPGRMPGWDDVWAPH